MSKMKELSMVLDELVTCGETLISTANALKEIFTDTAEAEKPPDRASSKKSSAKSKAQTAKPEPEDNPDDYPYEVIDDPDGETDSTEAAPAAEPKSAPASKPITKEQVRGILAAKSSAGHSAEVRALLAKFGAKQLKQVDPKDYDVLIKAAEDIGTDTGGKDEVPADE